MLAAFLGLAVPAGAEEPWGWELPKFSEPVHIVALYRSDEGHVLAWYVSNDTPEKIETPHRLAGLYDMQAHKELVPSAEAKAVTNYAKEQAFLAKHHLTPINYQSGIFNLGVSITHDYFAFFRCQYPYDQGFSINGDPYMIVWKRPHPVAKGYGCSYHGDVMASAGLTTRYHEQKWNWHWAVGTDIYFIMEDVPWVIRFDSKGQTHFFDHRKDAALVHAEKIRPLIEQMSIIDGGPPPPRPLLKQVEAIIDAQVKAAR